AAVSRGRRGGLPLGLRGQAPAGVAAIRIRFVPIYVHHRKLVVERHPSGEPALQPPAVALGPVAWRGRLTFALPALGRPPFAAAVPAFEHELEDPPVRHRRARDPERLELHRVSPFLVVEMESRAPLGADQVSSPRDLRVAAWRNSPGKGPSP